MPTINLYGDQYAFVVHPSHFLALIGGVGSGKTVAGAARALSFALGYCGYYRLDVPNTGMVTAPTYNVLRDATIPTFRDIAGDNILSITSSPPINAEMVNGSRIMFRSADHPELLRGPSITWWWGDEAALYVENVWRVMIGRLRQGGKLGYAWLTTTPKGRNWLYKAFVKDTKYAHQRVMYKLPTWRNPFIDRAYYEMLRESYSGDFARQELEGDFVAFEGLVYEEFARDIHAKDIHFPEQFALVAAGVDWGYANPGVIVVYGVDGDGRMWGLHEEYQRQRRIEEWCSVARQIQETYNVDYFFCDPSEPDFIAQFNQSGVNAHPANNEVVFGIQSVKARLAGQGDGLPRLLYPSSFVNTLAEYEQYQWMDHREGLKDAPKKVSDHTMDATRYCVVGVDAMFGVVQSGAMHYDNYTITASDY